MLCLTRKLQEKIVINGNIVITLLRLQGNKISLGIEAPSDVPIVRYELLPVDEQEKANNPS